MDRMFFAVRTSHHSPARHTLTVAITVLTVAGLVTGCAAAGLSPATPGPSVALSDPPVLPAGPAVLPTRRWTCTTSSSTRDVPVATGEYPQIPSSTDRGR
jgi:hypothetical protein